MLIATERTLALRCPVCGRLEFHKVSWFDFSGRSSLRIQCKCGFNKAILHTKNLQTYLLQMSCLVCEEVHILRFAKKEFWNDLLIPLQCPDTDQELGYIGSAAEIEKVVNDKRDNADSIFNNLGFDDYFSNPQVMFETLNHLHQLAEESQLFCRCGNDQIEIDVFPEKLELRCPNCQSLHIIYAETIDDLKIVKKAKLIALNEKGFTSFDSSKVHPV